MDPLTFDHLEQNVKSDSEKKVVSIFKNQRGNQSQFGFSETSNHDSLQNNHLKKINDFELICGNSLQSNHGHKKPFTIKEEIAYYISTRTQYELNLTIYWRESSKNLPMLSSLVRKFCIIPSTSVPSESAFSIANFIQRKERSCLSAETLKYSLILRYKGLVKELMRIYKLV